MHTCGVYLLWILYNQEDCQNNHLPANAYIEGDVKASAIKFFLPGVYNTLKL